MEYFIISIAAFFTAALTFLTGFGLGTLLMPVFAIFFSIQAAIALTAIVHLLNNMFRLFLFGKYADKEAVLGFGVPAVFSAYVGARTLLRLSHLNPIYSYSLFGRHLEILPVNLAIATLMMAFVLLEIPALRGFSLDKKYLPLGGLASGFFGGLSGNQGALRSAFLVKCGLTTETFIGTNVVIACMVDISRISVYIVYFSAKYEKHHLLLLSLVTLSAFLGSWIGSRLVKHVKIRLIEIIVAMMLFVFALLIGSGII